MSTHLSPDAAAALLSLSFATSRQAAHEWATDAILRRGMPADTAHAAVRLWEAVNQPQQIGTDR